MRAFRPCPRPTEPAVPRRCVRKLDLLQGQKGATLQPKSNSLFLSQDGARSAVGVKRGEGGALACPLLPTLLLQLLVQLLPAEPFLSHLSALPLTPRLPSPCPRSQSLPAGPHHLQVLSVPQRIQNYTQCSQPSPHVLHALFPSGF